MRVAREALSANLEPEVVEVLVADPALDVCPGVDAGRSVTLEVDLVTGGAVRLAAEEMVEADLVESRMFARVTITAAFQRM